MVEAATDAVVPRALLNPNFLAQPVCPKAESFSLGKKKGRPYLYVREIARVDGKPKVVSQIYLGSPERIAAMAAASKVITAHRK